jgi:transposase
MAYRIAGIDVHKKMVAVVIADVDVAGTWQFERRQLGTSPAQLRGLADWLVEREVVEVVMESTAQYWRPVWEALERGWQPRMPPTEECPRAGALHLAQAQSNEGPRGRKRDFPDAERLVKRLVAQELTLSFVPDVTQRLWRTVARRKYQSTCNRVQLQNRLECLLEEMHVKLSSLVADLIGPSARRMLRAIASGETDPGAVVALGSRRLHATPDQLRDALGACTDLHPVYRRLLALTLDELEGIERHIHALDEELARLLRGHQDAVERLAAVPGLGVDSAQQIITGSRSDRRHILDGEASRLVGRGLSGSRRERGHQSQPSGAERQSPDAPFAESSGQRRREGQRQYLSARVPTPRRPAGPCSSDRRDRPPALSLDLEDPPRRRHLRGTRASGHEASGTTARRQNDPGTACSRLSC